MLLALPVAGGKNGAGLRAPFSPLSRRLTPLAFVLVGVGDQPQHLVG